MVGWNGVPKTTQGPYFICDNGYMEWKQLICGYQGPLSSVEEKVFTSVVGSTRHIIENVFSHLKKGGGCWIMAFGTEMLVIIIKFLLLVVYCIISCVILMTMVVQIETY